jgi:hypothetical protein
MPIRRGADKWLKVMFDSPVTLQQGRRLTIKRVSASSASNNVEPAHNTTKYFVPNLRWGCQLMRGEWPARWEPQEKGVMSIAARFPSVKKSRFIVLGEERQTTEGDAC